MRRIVLLDHLDAGPAVLGDLIDVRPLQQPQAYVGVPQAIRRPPLALAVELELLLL